MRHFILVSCLDLSFSGVTLAGKIEEVIQWQPGLEEGPREDTPDDPRFQCIK